MSFRATATKALAWSGFQAATGALFQLAITAAMARLLDADDFGIVAVASVLIRFLAYFSQMGFGVAIVQRAEVSMAELRGLTSLSVATGAAFTVIGMAAASLVRPEIAPIVRALSVSFAITGFTAVPYGWLRRELANRQLAIIELTAQLVGTGAIAVTLAALGFKAWSLVLGTLAQQAVIAIAAWIAAARSGAVLGFAWPTATSRGYVSFGVRHSWNTFLEFLFYNVEVLAIGHWYGDASTGYYNRAYSLSHLAVEQVFSSVVRVLFPVLARLRGEPAKEQQAFFAAFLLGGLFASGFCAAMYVAAPQIIAVLFGAKWLPALPLLRVFAVVVPIRYLLNMQSAWLDAVGALRPRAIVIVACFALKLVAIAAAVHGDWSLPRLLIALVVPDGLWQLAYFVVVPVATGGAGRLLLAAYAWFVAVAAVVAIAIAGVTWPLAGVSPFIALGAQVATGGLLVGIAMIGAVRRRLLGIRAEVFVDMPVIGRLAGTR